MLAAPTGAGAVSISVPSSANLGSHATGGGTLSAQLDAVTVTGSGTAVIFTATVTATNFTTGGATSNETIGRASLSYWSGAATSASGLSVSTAGQLTAAQAVSLSSSRTAFSGASVISLGSFSVSWKPTLAVTIPAAAVVGTYSGTITHSVA